MSKSLNSIPFKPLSEHDPHLNKKRGFTLIELLLAFSLLVLFSASVALLINPFERRQIAQDQKRISDLVLLDRMLSEFVVDNGTLPDTINTLRSSNILPATATGPLSNSASGWIDADLSLYNQTLPVDPVNDVTFKYEYQHTGPYYEIRARLSQLSNEALNDGGDDPDYYELGSDLTVL